MPGQRETDDPQLADAQPDPTNAALILPNAAIAKNLTYPQYLALRHHARTRGPAPHQHDFACEVLIAALQHGPLPVGQFENPHPGTIALHAKQAGLPQGTILRAKKTLQIPSTQTATGWLWTLPSTIPTLAPAAAEVPPVPSLAVFPPPRPQAPETCAPDPLNQAQVLTPPTPATPPTPSTDNPSTCPTPTPDTPATPAAPIVPPVPSLAVFPPPRHQSPETCAPDPQNSAQVLTPPSPDTPPTPSHENPRAFPTPTPAPNPEDISNAQTL